MKAPAQNSYLCCLETMSDFNNWNSVLNQGNTALQHIAAGLFKRATPAEQKQTSLLSKHCRCRYNTPRPAPIDPTRGSSQAM